MQGEISQRAAAFDLLGGSFKKNQGIITKYRMIWGRHLQKLLLCLSGSLNFEVN